MAKQVKKIGTAKTGDEKDFKGSGVEGEKEADVVETPRRDVSTENVEDKKRTSVLTIQDGKAVRIFFEEGKEVGREEA